MMQTLLIGLVKAYRVLLGSWMRPSCRFFPSCSEYSMQALRRHGAIDGTWLTVHRLVRCGPWCQGGDDPVPLEAPRLFSHLVSPHSDTKKNS